MVRRDRPQIQKDDLVFDPTRLTDGIDIWQIVFFRAIVILVVIGAWIWSLHGRASFAVMRRAGMPAVIAGVGQVLFGSLAYLIPVLLGPGPRLTRNFDRMDSHRWLPLTALNGAAVALIADVPTVTLILLAVWLVDLLRRLVTLERTETATP